MNVTVRIPDDLAARVTSTGADLERRVLEVLALDEFRAGRLTRFELRRTLGFQTRFELDGFLKERGVNDGMTVEEWEEEQRTLDRLGL